MLLLVSPVSLPFFLAIPVPLQHALMALAVFS